MANPYQTPSSEFDISKSKSNVKWKAFFWFILILQSASIIFMTIEHEETWYYILGDFFVYSAILTGIFGYAYRKRIFRNWFWRLVFIVGIVWDLYSFAQIEFIDLELTEYIFDIVIVLAISLPIFVFQYIALFEYGYKSKNIWESL